MGDAAAGDDRFAGPLAGDDRFAGGLPAPKQFGAPLVPRWYLQQSPLDLARIHQMDFMDYVLDMIEMSEMRGADRALLRRLRRVHSCFF